MQDTAANNKRIAKNTLFLYIRMGISMLISLYTSRVILEILGIVDLGIYNVIGGITTSFLWLSGTFSNATQRYLNFEIGTNSPKRLQNVFNQSFWIFVAFAAISFIILETGGRWFVLNKLSIPSDRLDASLWVLHATSITLVITLIGCVYDGVLVAHENMKVYAYIGLADVILKLAIVYCLLLTPLDKLKVYSVLLCIVFSFSKLLAIVYCHRHYAETKIKLYWNKDLFSEMTGFIGWNSVTTVVFIANNQGIDVLLNMFFGPVVNAAKAITNQIRNVVLNFTSNFLTAVRPQIIKSYSSGELDSFFNLIFCSSRYLFFISWIIGLPLMLRINDVLFWWLKNVPDYTASFTIWTLIFVMINVITDPINTAFQALGKQKRYAILGSGIYILAFPLSYLALKMGSSPTLPFIILAFVRLVFLFVVVRILQDEIYFSYKTYMKDVLLPILKVILITALPCYFLNLFIEGNNIGWMITIIAIHFMYTGICILCMGLSTHERKSVINVIKKKVKFG